MITMNAKTVVITGSTQGFGRALAESFLERGHRVLVCSRNKENVRIASLELKPKYKQNMSAMIADVSDYEDCVRMAELAIRIYGSVDVWINNAASNAYARKPYLEFDPDDIRTVVETNLLGTMNCCHAIMPHMMKHKQGIVVNVEGAGSENNETRGYAVYGATKSAITQFTHTLRAEYSCDDVRICLLSPGMMFTRLLLCCDDTSPEIQFVFDTYGEHPNDVSERVVPKILAIRKHDTIRDLTWWKIVRKTVTALFRLRFSL